MVTIIAIGGGEIGRPGTKKEVIPIDKRIIAETGKKRPRLLFLPTASGDSSGYCAVVEKYFGGLGARVSHLRLLKDPPGAKAIDDAVRSADIIYVGGGNTKDMMRVWKRTGFDRVLRKYAKSDKVYCGVSAGAVCWFDTAWSDSLRMKNPKAPYATVPCLGLVPGMYSPHAIREPDRVPSLERYLATHKAVAYSVDDCAALLVKDGDVTVLSSKRDRGATLYWSDGKTRSSVRLTPRSS